MVRLLRSAAIVLSVVELALGNVFSYEANSFPEQAGFNIIQIYCDPELGLEQAWFVQHVELCPGDDPPGGQQASYRRSLADFIGAATFFVQWRMMTDAPRSEMPWGGGAAISTWSNGAVNYLFSMTADQAELNRDNTLPIILVDVEPGVPHVYRLELVGSQSYTWFIDSQVVHTGTPEGPYPSFNPNMNFRTKAAWTASTSRWDYIRFGLVPQPNTGDYNSDQKVDHEDLYFFLDCLLGPDYDASGPGCRWADMNSDGVANGADIAQFTAAMIAA